ncbi:hypothetical protein J2X49_001550 [Agrococcus sp. BE272]|nr:hypothetical protein [Agrococcus sp. BE272]
MQPRPEVQPRPARRVAGQQHADLLAPLDGVARSHGGLDGLEARHEAAGVLDRHHGAAGHRPREADDAVVGREHRRAGRRGDVDPAMARPVGARGRVEGAHDLVRLDRPRPRRERRGDEEGEEAHPGMVPRIARCACGEAVARWRTAHA